MFVQEVPTKVLKYVENSVDRTAIDKIMRWPQLRWGASCMVLWF